jgi:membrane protein YqaA with SNARE-associated domain
MELSGGNGINCRLSRSQRLLALAWGFAEATLFFVVPDVLITLFALRGFSRGLVTAGYALIGALVGGALMWTWGARDLPGARLALGALPAIGSALMDRTATELAHEGIVGMLGGSFVGVPYKIYAVHAASSGIGVGTFLGFSVPARLTRFVLLAYGASHAGRWMERRYSRRVAVAVWLTAWTINYAIYWSVMPG